MSIFDIMQMCLRNLYRRKGRTMLTVSGVVIGCCAIVIMVSLGIGMREAQNKMLAQMGNLTRITVSPSPGNHAGKPLLDKKALGQMENFPNVKSVIGKKSLELGELMLTTGEKNRFQSGNISITGVQEKDFEKMGYQLMEGKFPLKRPFQVLAGKNFAFEFTDSKRPDGKNMVDYWMDENAKPYFNALGADISLTQKKEKKSAEGEQLAAGSAEYKEVQKLTVVGRMEENYDVGEETISGVIMRMGDLEKLQKQLQRVDGRKRQKEYSQILVNVQDMKDVEQVEEQIKQMGFQTFSMESIRKPMEKDAQQKQMMLGGLGAISLFVAAIGIANTMIMSIAERTREIGIMKALGCFLGDIRKEFLMEAAFIGLIGGSLGIALSYVASWILNYFSASAAVGGGEEAFGMGGMGMMASAGSDISIIPVWLAVFALAFSIFIGVAAGYYPANKAVRISALEAMKA